MVADIQTILEVEVGIKATSRVTAVLILDMVVTKVDTTMVVAMIGVTTTGGMVMGTVDVMTTVATTARDIRQVDMMDVGTVEAVRMVIAKATVPLSLLGTV